MNMNLPLQLQRRANTYDNTEQYIPPKNALLDAYAIALHSNVARGYPAQHNRLYIDRIPYDDHGLIALPNCGPWAVGSILPTREEKHNEVLHNIGYPKMCELDADYRALHPWWKDMVKRHDIGGVVGKGFFYHWGANYAADAAVTMTDEHNTKHILLIQRQDTGEWALPGGFVDPYEATKATAVRELQEETGLVLNRSNATAKKLYTGPVLDVRTTLHAWVETSLWLFEASFRATPTVMSADDALHAQWFAVTDIPDELYGSHPILIQMALNQI
jgi:ADP-ribose pyrophosphatase YjhB (NUDIX family)